MFIDFFNSNFFGSLSTVLTAFVAWLVYRSTVKNNKIQAARVLITEIRIAEERIEQVRNKIENDIPSDFPPIFPTKSWKKYSHLFISDFDQDELKLLNTFYDYGEVIEEFAKRDNDFFWVSTEERARVTVHQIANFITQEIKDNTKSEEQKSQCILNSINKFNLLLDRNNLPYSPQKSLNEIKKILPKMPNITTSTCGLKLKKIAKLAI